MKNFTQLFEHIISVGRRCERTGSVAYDDGRSTFVAAGPLGSPSIAHMCPETGTHIILYVEPGHHRQVATSNGRRVPFTEALARVASALTA